MSNKPTRITVNKRQLELVNRCLLASSVPTISALFSHFLTLYGEDYIGRYGTNKDEQQRTIKDDEGLERTNNQGRYGTNETPIIPTHPQTTSKPAIFNQNNPIVEIICE
jgi:hypothetical protein